MNAYFKTFADSLVEMLNAFLELFYSKENEDYLSEEIKKSWNYLKEQEDPRLLKLFCAKFALLNKWNSMCYLSEHASDTTVDVRNGNIDWRISTLSVLLEKEPKMCCQIIEKMVKKQSVNLEELSSMLVNCYGIQPLSYSKKYAVQQEILSYFLEESKECPLDFMKKYCLDILRFINDRCMIHGNKVTYTTIEVRDGDENYRQLRDQCFKVLFRCNDFYDSLESYFSNYPQDNSLGLFKDDLIDIQNALIKKKERNSIRELSLYFLAKKTLDYYSISWEYMQNHLKELLNLISPIFDTLKTSVSNDYGVYQDENERKMELFKECVQNSSFEDNLKRLKIFDQMLEYSNEDSSEINAFCAAFINSLNKQNLLSNLSVLLSFKKLANSVHDYEDVITQRLVTECGVNDSYSLILNIQDSDFKEREILYFWKIAFEMDKNASNKLFDEYLKNIKVAMPSKFNISNLLSGKAPIQKVYLLLKTYFDISKEASNGDYCLIFNSFSYEGKDFFDYLLNNDINLLEKIYLLCLEGDKNSFDHYGLYLNQIVEKDNKFVTEILKKLYEDGGCLESLEKMEAVWECASYISVGDNMFEYLKPKLHGNIIFKRTYMFGFNPFHQKEELSSNQLNWLISYLNRHPDEKTVKCLNALCRHLGNETRNIYEKQLINDKVAPDLVADSLEIPSFFSYTHSENEIIEPLIDLCEKLLEWIPKNLDFLEYGTKIDNQKTKLKGMLQ